MNENEIFKDWGDLEDGKESVWGADWYIDLDQQKKDIFLTISYKGEEEFIWYHDAIKQAFDDKTVKEFVDQYIKDVSEEDIKELTDFFFHWLMIVDAGGTMDMEVADEDLIELDVDDQ